MSKTLLFVVYALAIAGACKSANAQGMEKPGIIGMVTDVGENPVPFANVALYGVDSVLVAGTSTNEMGRYRLLPPEGDYYLLISFLSYETQVITNISYKGKGRLPLQPVRLVANAQLLEEVMIEGEKSTMELQLDKRVFNVGKDLANSGQSAAEILTNVPSVEVDVEGNVSLRGSENVRILIDGKPSGLVSGGSAEALRMLQGNMIEKVEVITNPSARYEAEGEVGVINLVLKKEEQRGINGAFEIKGGYPTNHGASFNLNYRRKWINLFSSYGATFRETPGSGYSSNSYDGPDTSYFFNNTRNHTRGGLGHTGRFGADFYMNKNNVLTASGLYSIRDNNNTGSIIYQDLSSSQEILTTTSRDENENEISQNIEFDLNYKKSFKQKGREWTSSFSFRQSDDSEEASLTQSSTDFSLDNQLQRSSNTEDEQNIRFQSDYIHPVGKKGKFETGIRGSIRAIENFFNVDIDSTGVWENLGAFTNQLKYSEEIYAGYGMFSNSYKKLDYQLGLRSEYTLIETELVLTNQRNPREYLNLFPSGHLSYEFKEEHFLQLNYSRRISRPHFRNLIPFYGYTDPRNFYSGNPDLNPEFTHSFETGYLHSFEKGSILASVYYRYSDNVVERITVTDSTGLLRRFPINLGIEHAIGIELNTSYELAKWWRFTGTGNFYHQLILGDYQGRNYDIKGYTMQFRISNMIKLPQKINFQASMNYRAPRPSPQGTTLAMYNIDLALSRDFLKGNATLALSVRDLTNARKWRNIIDTEHLYSEGEFQWRARQFMATFTYRLNQKKKRERSGGMGGDVEM